jgi:hemoglobin-like flavoprotein
MDHQPARIVEDSLNRCMGIPTFLDRFYELFLASSPKVHEKFAQTNFTRQKRALQASLHSMVSFAVSGEAEPSSYLREVADLHSHDRLGIGAELYDLWLDSLLTVVKETDPKADAAVLEAWESTMVLGIRYFLSRY